MPSLSCTRRLCSFLNTPKCKLYCSYALSSWADRLWQFALSLVLVEIGGDLRLVAINGLIDCLAVLLFASSIGRWIDAKKRLTAVAMSAGVLLVVQYWEKEISPLWSGAVRIFLIIVAILLCAISILTQTGTKIVLTKDWVVVMCNNEKDKLA
uniref:Solute carrier family 40 member n=1 Tax=Plectus sambesii TaxID=2011161 RepID=A0A914VGI2_9BILA